MEILKSVGRESSRLVDAYLPVAVKNQIGYLHDKVAPLIGQLGQLLGIDKSNVKVSVVKIAGVTFFTFSILYLGKIWLSFGYFEKKGVKTPKNIRLISGNYHEVVKNGYSEQLAEWTKQLGKFYGFYEGHTPIMVTSDPDIAQEIFIKQYTNFMARKLPPAFASDEAPGVNVFFASRNRWKRMRNIMNPTFSPAKLKELLPIMKMCSERLVEELKKYEGKELLLNAFLSRFTMDTICNCAFGMDLDVFKNPNDLFLVNASYFFDNLSNFRGGIFLPLYFPEIKPVFIPIVRMVSILIGSISTSLIRHTIPIFWIISHISKVIDLRKNSTVKKRDYVSILMEAQSEDLDIKQDKTSLTNEKIAQTRFEKKMTFEEVKVNLAAFMVAGYDTTSTSLSYSLYVLAKYPEERIKLQNEFDAKFDRNALVSDYDQLMDLQYLDMFIKEVFRMYPLANNIVNRRCTVPCKINNVDIDADQIIVVDVMTLHYNPEYWGPVDPNEFYPPRFSPEIKRHPCVYMPFGLGPRQCIGMRFALLEIKLALVNILLRYDVLPSANTPDKLEYVEGPAVRRPKNSIPLLLQKRS